MDINIRVAFAIVLGIIPTLLWLWFWLQEDKLHPEPKNRLALTFFGGMVSVLVVLPIEKLIYGFIGDLRPATIILWSAVEEICKFAAVYFIAIHNKDTDEPIDAVIYMITGALGFSALENTFFLWNIVDNGLLLQTFITGNMRFVGATLLHTASSAVVGILYALYFYRSTLKKELALFIGLIIAIVLHSLFNLLIIRSEQGIFLVFAGLWLLLTFIIVWIEKVKRTRLK